jgi:hypothetical protein
MSGHVFDGLGPLALIGHSHIWAVADAIKPLPQGTQVIDLWKISNPFHRNEAPAMEALKDTLPDNIVSFIGGNRYEALAMYKHPRAFDFILPAEPDAPLEPGAEIIPYDAVRRTVLEIVEYNFALTEKLRELTRGVFLQIEAPPPWGDERRVEDWDPGLISPTDSFGSRQLRMKFYKLHTNLVRELCRNSGVDLVQVPQAAVDEEGFLRPPFHRDIVHANAAYGALMAQAIAKRLRERLGR